MTDTYKMELTEEQLRWLLQGICENFYPSGTCAFRNDEDKVLIVDYRDIVQMKPSK